jgi:hypothetical protein
MVTFLRRFSPYGEPSSVKVKWKEYITLVLEEDLSIKLALAE